MKFLNTHFEEYISACKKNNLHEYITYKPSSIEQLNNVILYGPSGCGKYTQSLKIIQKISPSKLKYEKKLTVIFNKQLFNFKLSDIHIEIDMSLLGCNAKILWNDLYNKILDIAIAKPNNSFIIICKNFHQIHNELLENFYSYMQTIHFNTIVLKFILITEELSFINNNIVNRCEIISVPRPTKAKYIKCIENINISKINISKIMNIKDTIALINNNNIKPHENICNYIIKKMIDTEDLNYASFRDNIYNLLILNMDIHESIWYILHELYKLQKLKKENIINILKKMYIFFQYYNNNYRPIYHLESFLLYLISEIHEY